MKDGKRKHPKKNSEAKVQHDPLNRIARAAAQQMVGSKWSAKPEKAKDYDRKVDAQARGILHHTFGKMTYYGAQAGHMGARAHYFSVDKPLSVKGGGPLTRLYHGTSLYALACAVYQGRLRASYSGMLGPGVYLGTKAKAQNYTKGATGDDGSVFSVLLVCEAALGRVSTERRADCDTVHAARGGNVYATGGHLNHSEWCVKDEQRVRIVEVYVQEVRPVVGRY